MNILGMSKERFAALAVLSLVIAAQTTAVAADTTTASPEALQASQNLEAGCGAIFATVRGETAMSEQTPLDFQACTYAIADETDKLYKATNEQYQFGGELAGISPGFAGAFAQYADMQCFPVQGVADYFGHGDTLPNIALMSTQDVSTCITALQLITDHPTLQDANGSTLLAPDAFYAELEGIDDVWANTILAYNQILRGTVGGDQEALQNLQQQANPFTPGAARP